MVIGIPVYDPAIRPSIYQNELKRSLHGLNNTLSLPVKPSASQPHDTYAQTFFQMLLCAYGHFYVPHFTITSLCQVPIGVTAQALAAEMVSRGFRHPREHGGVGLHAVSR
jgi:hypothetical protein